MTKKINSKEIIKEIEKRKDELSKRGIKKIGLFGSVAKNQHNKNSDIDIIVSFDKPSFDSYMELKFLLEKIFKRKVDLVMEKSLRPELKYIKKEAKYARI
jgi:hypothetical protein